MYHTPTDQPCFYPLMTSETGSFESAKPYENSRDITVKIGVPVGKQLVVWVDYFKTTWFMDGVELVIDERDVYYFTGIHDVSSDRIFRSLKSVSDIDVTENDNQYGSFDGENTETYGVLYGDLYFGTQVHSKALVSTNTNDTKNKRVHFCICTKKQMRCVF